jgi:hypothetical protein
MAVAAAQAAMPRQGAVVADGKGLPVAQAVATVQDAQHSHQEQILSRKPNPAPHPLVRDRPKLTDQGQERVARRSSNRNRGPLFRCRGGFIRNQAETMVDGYGLTD